MAALDLDSIRLFSVALGAALALAAPARAADVSVQLDAGSGFSVKNSTGASQRLRVDEATGNISRNGALFVHTTGPGNTFVGPFAGNLTTTGGNNTAFGQAALGSNTTGYQNSAVGEAALLTNTTGSRNAAFGRSALRNNTTGSRNSAFGTEALRDNTTGNFNAASGTYALRVNTTGQQNSAFGDAALLSNTTGSYNSAFGEAALVLNTIGARNSAFGDDALYANTGSGYENTAFGARALRANTSGDNNVAVGFDAGANQTTGNNNIYIANPGVSGESGQIKIGTAMHTQATIRGIFGNTRPAGTTVFVDANGLLGTTTSSAAFKQDVNDMGDTSALLGKLRPVTFRYKPEVADGDQTLQYGLIAEEVAEVAPQLVVTDAKGKPYSVRYHELPAILLNEMQKQRHTIEEQVGLIEVQQTTMQLQEKKIAALTTRLTRLESRLISAPGEAQRSRTLEHDGVLD